MPFYRRITIYVVSFFCFSERQFNQSKQRFVGVLLGLQKIVVPFKSLSSFDEQLLFFYKNLFFML